MSLADKAKLLVEEQGAFHKDFEQSLDDKIAAFRNHRADLSKRRDNAFARMDTHMQDGSVAMNAIEDAVKQLTNQ